MAGANRDADRPIGELISQLVEQGGDVVRAEVTVYRRLALRKMFAARVAVALMLAGVLLAFGSAGALVIGLAIGLARFVGPVAGGVIAGLIGFVVAGLLFREGLKRLPSLSPVEDADDGDGKA